MKALDNRFYVKFMQLKIGLFPPFTRLHFTRFGSELCEVYNSEASRCYNYSEKWFVKSRLSGDLIPCCNSFVFSLKLGNSHY